MTQKPPMPHDGDDFPGMRPHIVAGNFFPFYNSGKSAHTPLKHTHPPSLILRWTDEYRTHEPKRLHVATLKVKHPMLNI
jgi:hypothetical protein